MQYAAQHRNLMPFPIGSLNCPDRYQKAIWDNRMQYAAKHGYRYCEMQMHDRNKIPAFAKLPWILVRRVSAGMSFCPRQFVAPARKGGWGLLGSAAVEGFQSLCQAALDPGKVVV